MITRAEIASTIQEVERLQDKISIQCRDMVDIVDKKLDQIKTLLTDGSINEEDFDLMERLMFMREWLWERMGP